MSIESLQAKLQDIIRRSDAIRAAADAMDRTLTDAERDKLDELADQFDSIEADIRRMETIERQRRAAGGTAPADPAPAAAQEASSARQQPRVGPQPAPDPARVKRAESMLIALGVVAGVFAALYLLLFGDVLTMLVNGSICLLTFLLGYKAIKDGNVRTARTFSLTLGVIIMALLALMMIGMVAAADELALYGGLVWVVWALWGISWLFATGYIYAYQCLSPKGTQTASR